MNDIVCPIWCTAVKSSTNVGDSLVVDSPRAGGKFILTGSARILTVNLSTEEQTRITNWLVDQRATGIDLPILNSQSIPVAKTYRFFPVSEMVDRALIWIAENLDSLGSNIPLGTHIPNYFGHEVLAENTQSLAAAAGCLATKEAIEVIEFSVEEGWVSSNNKRLKNEGGFFSLTYRGHQRVESLKATIAAGRSAFVAMWFSKSMDDIYASGFASAVADAGYEPIRIDRKEHNNKIDDEIVAEIRRSKFVIADFTSEVVDRHSLDGKSFKDTHARGGVYFEAGFAKGLGKEVIWTVREDVLPFVHFDTRQFAHIVWKDAADLRAQLSRRISATLGDGPNKKPS